MYRYRKLNSNLSEADAGSLTWLMSALGFPDYPAEVYAYGTVIGTGNVVAAWHDARARAEVAR